MSKTQVMTIAEFMTQKSSARTFQKHDILLLLGFGTTVVALNLVAHSALTAFEPAQTLVHAVQAFYPDVSIATVSHSDLSSLSDSGYQHVISRKFDESIWPIFVDIGTPLGEVSMGMGAYRMIRGDVSEGWKLFSRAAIGLFLLYMIEPTVRLIVKVGEGFAGGYHP